MNTIGIRHEDKYKLERRAPLTPDHIVHFLRHNKINLLVEKSDKRIFEDDIYQQAGATLVDTLEDCNVILGVKEMPIDFFEQNKTYVFFSHVIKGQPYNMPMLKEMMNKKCTLIDYEKISDRQNRRLIFFWPLRRTGWND